MIDIDEIDAINDNKINQVGTVIEVMLVNWKDIDWNVILMMAFYLHY